MPGASQRSVPDLLADQGWIERFAREIPGSPAVIVPDPALDLTPASQRLLKEFGHALYRHQHRAIALATEGHDVSIATGTASGKTLAFQVAAVDIVTRRIGSRVMVLYPLKALGLEQEERWGEALRALYPVQLSVARIDGSVSQKERLSRLRNANIVLFTPDVIHAWLLRNLSDPTIQGFLRQLKLMIVDEAHTYRGVFGSNAAFLFRRLCYATQTLSGEMPHFFAASATMADPKGHLERLMGRTPLVVGPEEDTSPRQTLDLRIVDPPPGQDVTSAVGRLLASLAQNGHRFLAFADSRHQVEVLATVATRKGGWAEAEEGTPGGPPKILPYRSGYEERDRRQIQRALVRGDLVGVVSTSALELGLDIGELDVGLAVGVPVSQSTFMQRMGRVGRRRPGSFLVLLGSGAGDVMVRENRASLLERRLEATGIYLENRRMQYIHALCLAGPDGEADALGAGEDWDLGRSEVAWPPGFAELCQREREGRIPPELRTLKTDGGADPWHAFPLRDVESGFEIVQTMGPSLVPMGSITHAQLMREAYPGAVYFYMAQPFRVQSVDFFHRRVRVTAEHLYHTKPLTSPVALWPDLDNGLMSSVRYGDLTLLESQLTVSETVRGFEERRGANTSQSLYPNAYWNRNVLRRTFLTTGVLLISPALRDSETAHGVAELLLAAFVLTCAIERNELQAGSSTIRHRDSVLAGERFVAIYDQTYGSLRLSSALTDPDTLRTCLVTAYHLAEEDPAQPNRWALSMGALKTLLGALESPEVPLSQRALIGGASLSDQVDASESIVPVIAPGSVGLLLTGSNSEFQVEAVFLRPTGLTYRGHRLGGAPGEGDVQEYVPAANVVPIPGESEITLYDLETGETRPTVPASQKSDTRATP